MAMDFLIDFDLFLALTGLTSGEHGNWTLSAEGIRSSVSADGPFQNGRDERLRRRLVQQAELSFPTTAHQLREWESRNDRVTPEWFDQVVDATPEDVPAVLTALHVRVTGRKNDAARRSAVASTATLSRQERLAAKVMAEQDFDEALAVLEAVDALLDQCAAAARSTGLSVDSPHVQPGQDGQESPDLSALASKAGKASGVSRSTGSLKTLFTNWLEEERRSRPGLTQGQAVSSYCAKHPNANQITIKRYASGAWKQGGSNS
jgi:hypothetical protein